MSDVLTLPGLASTAVAGVLDAPLRPATLLGRFPSAVYISVGEAVVAVVTRDGVRLPNAIVVRPASTTEPFSCVDGEAEIAVGTGRVAMGGIVATIVRWWEPRPQLGTVTPAALAAALDTLEAELPPRDVSCRGLSERASALSVALAGHDDTTTAQSVRHLVGYGPGLTPAGDDVLAGVLVALRLLGGALGTGTPSLAETVSRAMAAAAPSATTTLSHALLRHAARGECATSVAGLLRALTGDGQVRPAAQELLQVGHTSGRELAAGLVLGARVCLDQLAISVAAEGQSP